MVTLLSGNRFQFDGGDPKKMCAYLAKIFQCSAHVES
jgi:hypothetical protein